MLVRAGRATAPSFVLLDLERVRDRRPRSPSAGGMKNLVQLERTLGRARQRAPTRLRFLRAYLGPERDRADAPRRGPRAVAARGRAQGSPRGRAGAAGARRRGRAPSSARTRRRSIGAVPRERRLVRRGRRRRRRLARRHGRRSPRRARGARDPQSVAGLPRAEAVRARGRRRSRGCSTSTPTSASRPSWPTEIRRRARARARRRRRLRDPAPRAVPRSLVVSRRLVSAPVVRLVRRVARGWGGIDPHDRAEVPRPRASAARADPPLHVRRHRRPPAQRRASSPRSRRRRCRAGRRVGLGAPRWRAGVALRARRRPARRASSKGMPGFFVAATDAFYVFLRWARVWDRERRA